MTDYIRNLRKLIGHKPIILCGASVIVENEKGGILLQLRADNNCWSNAGGAVEFGETVEEAAARELFEETGLIADELELFGVFSGKELHYIYPNGDEVYNVEIAYICRKYHGMLNCDRKEVKELRFFELNEIPDNISPPVRKTIGAYIDMVKQIDNKELLRKKMSTKKIMIVIGTRPEITKMFPLIEELKKNSDKFDTKLVVTGQHREQLHQMLDCFGLVPDINMDIMKPNQSLSYITSATVSGLDDILTAQKPDMVLVHGDTAATLSASLAAFYHKIPVGHVEAGLRSYNKLSPWPEEVNRRATDVIADLLFAPTHVGRENLLREGCDPKQIFITGQTAVDTAMLPRHDNYKFNDGKLRVLESYTGRIIAMTAHRRENYGQPFDNMFTAIRRLTDEFPDVLVVYPVHLSPVVREAANRVLSGHERIMLLEPADYMDMIRLMRLSYMVMSDSGGLQEETAVFGKPMILMRDTTERPEGVEAGSVYLSGVKEEDIYSIGRKLLTDSEYYTKMASAKNPFGDGQASRRIVQIMAHYFGMSDSLPDEFC